MVGFGSLSDLPQAGYIQVGVSGQVTRFWILAWRVDDSTYRVNHYYEQQGSRYSNSRVDVPGTLVGMPKKSSFPTWSGKAWYSGIVLLK